MNTGVYVIEHRESGKKYVGSAAKSFRSRWRQQRHRLRKGKHHSRHLQSAWNKYGEEAFVFRILRRTLPGEAVEQEQVFIDLYQATDPKHGYNIAPIQTLCKHGSGADSVARREEGGYTTCLARD